MKTVCYCIILLIVISCSSVPNYSSLENIKKIEYFYQEVLINDININSINKLYNQIHLEELNNLELNSLRSNVILQRALVAELKLLKEWKPAIDFIPYATPDSIERRCGSFDQAPPSAQRIPINGRMSAISYNYYNFEVPVAIHIINSKNATIAEDMDMRRKIDLQMGILNKEYSNTQIKFMLRSINTHTNINWYKSSPQVRVKAFSEMCQSLSIEPENTMNIYILNCEVIGQASFPWSDSNGTVMDFVIINFNSLPEGSLSYFEGRYNQGETLVHEVGHYLGLYHTFEGGFENCQDIINNKGCEIGDYVEDTPSQKICYFDGCGFVNDQECDSCPDDGKDPVQNFMGYNPDFCMNEFTRGQIIRMKQSILRFRDHFIVNPIEEI